jgi:hypothetical protein
MLAMFEEMVFMRILCAAIPLLLIRKPVTKSDMV